MKRTLTLILALLMILSTFLAVACAETKEEEKETTNDETQGEIETEAETTRADVSDDLPENDYDGTSWRVLTYYANEYWLVMTNEECEDVLDESIVKRNQKIEDRFNIVIDYYVPDNNYMGATSALEETVMSGMSDYEVYMNHALEVGQKNSRNDLLINLSDCEYLDFDREWWEGATESLKYNDVILMAVGSLDLMALNQAYGVAYNKTLGADKNITDDLIELTKNHEWTVEKFNSLIVNTWDDVNGDSTKDEDDVYGYVGTGRGGTSGLNWFFSTGFHTAKIEDDGTIVADFMTEKVVDFTNWFYDIVWDNTNTYYDQDNWGLSNSFFYNKKAVFADVTLGNFMGYKEVDGMDYTIVPYPTWDDTETRYYSSVDGNHTATGIPVTTADVEFASIILEAMNAETWRSVFPAYYDITLKAKGAQDAETEEMLDLIANSRIYDFGYYYAWSNAPQAAVYKCVHAKGSDISSYYDANFKAKFEQELIDIQENFEKYL